MPDEVTMTRTQFAAYRILAIVAVLSLLTLWIVSWSLATCK